MKINLFLYLVYSAKCNFDFMQIKIQFVKILMVLIIFLLF